MKHFTKRTLCKVFNCLKLFPFYVDPNKKPQLQLSSYLFFQRQRYDLGTTHNFASFLAHCFVNLLGRVRAMRKININLF